MHNIISFNTDFRPVYPNSVCKIITSYMKSNDCSGFQHAVDVGCGSGQSTVLLCEHFKEVFGYDISQEKIALAKYKKRTSNIHFTKADACNLPVLTSSVDLLTCAMSWHWLDVDKFYTEAKRVLKPRGCTAVYCYNAKVSDHKAIGIAYETFIAELTQSGCYSKQSMDSL